jgi:hypothetical protein
MAVPSTFSTVEIRGTVERDIDYPRRLFLRRGETAVINDRSVVGNLAGFFPGLGSGKAVGGGLHSPPILEFVFERNDGSKVLVYTKLYRYWGSDSDPGDKEITGDLESYLEALFANPKVQRTGSPEKKE